MDNPKIAQIFQEIGDILEILDKDRFRISSYHQAAQTIASLSHDLRDVWHEDPKALQKIPGIGKSLAEILKTGDCKDHQQLLKKIDPGMLTLLTIRGLGPKKVKLFYKELKIKNTHDLEKAAKSGKIRELPRMGEKSEKEILKAIKESRKYQKRMLLSTALREATALINHLKECPAVKRVEYAGSLRRKKETIGDLDILAIGTKAEEITRYFIAYPEVSKVLVQGKTKTSVLLKSGVQSDLRILPQKSFGAAYHYFTGSKEHNIVIRERAKKKKLKINEYGVFRGKKMVAGKTEEEIFKSVGLPFIPPEMRENSGEIEAAEKGKLPRLVEQKDIKGDLHVHTNWSDGDSSLKEMVVGAKNAGLSYIAITDHASPIGIVHGLDEKRLRKQIKEIDRLNQKLKGFRVLKGAEVDILPSGKLHLSDHVLAQLDIVIASIHTRFRLPKKEQTDRILQALQNPHLNILGHPTGRLINKREPIAIDMEAVISEAKKKGVSLELNASPERLDLNDIHCKLAKEKGVKISISTDTHHHGQYALLKFGIATARRGWLTKKDVLNTLPVEKLLKALRKTP